MTEKPTRLRRSRVGEADPPAGTQIGSTTILAPLEPDEGDPGFISGTSNEGMNRSGGTYKDAAVGATFAAGPRPPAQSTPFANLRAK